MLADDLRNIIKGEVDDSDTARDLASRDASLFRVLPEVVVHPQDTADIEALVGLVSERKRRDSKSNISLTARSAGTDMSGGPLSSSIVVDMTAHFTKVLEVGKEYAITEPGVYFRDFDIETKKHNLELPSYTASREINTLGGMVANDSGGEKNLKYGKTAHYVEELDVVLSDGKTHTLRNLAGDALTNKLAEQNFEGDLYRGVASVLHRHVQDIATGKPEVTKNSAGYALWDIGDGEHSLNLARLMVGAQGTLGIITRAKVELVRPKPYASMVVMFLRSFAQVGEVVPTVLAAKPDSFESYDDHTFRLAVKYFPEFAAQMKLGLFGMAFSFLPEVWMALTGGVPSMVLLAEFRGDTQGEALQAAQALAARLHAEHPEIKAHVARDEAAARKYWVIRRESFSLLRKKIRGMRTAPFIDDFVVPPAKLPEFLPELEVVLSKYDFLYTVAGHVGDGNFHIIPLVDPHRPDLAAMVDELSLKVYDLVVKYHGSITGEHNDGMIRTPYLSKMFAPGMIAAFHEIKTLFDPFDIFNPGKKVGGSLSVALTHLDIPKKE